MSKTEVTAWSPDHVIVWSPLQQQWIDQARHHAAEVTTWPDRSMAMDTLHRLARRHFNLSHGETVDWAACYRQIACIYQSACRLRGRRRR